MRKYFDYQHVKSFQYASFDSEHLACLAGQRFTEDGNYGYVLINGHLVPYSFISRLEDELGGAFYEYNEVYSLEDIFGTKFLESLTSNELKVLGGCMLILIEKGDFWICDDIDNDEADEDEDEDEDEDKDED